MKTKITKVEKQIFDNVYRIYAKGDIQLLDIYAFDEIPKINDQIEYEFNDGLHENGCTINGKIFKISDKTIDVSFGGYIGVFDKAVFKKPIEEGNNFSIWYKIGN